MYSIGEFRNSLFDDSEDSPPHSNSPTPITSPSTQSEMLRQPMLASRDSAGPMNALGALRSTAQSRSELATSDPCMPTRLDASTFSTALTKSSSSALDRDQALRHSHVMETVRSLVLDKQQQRWSARSKQITKTTAMTRSSSTLPSAPARRQTVATAQRRAAIPPPQPPRTPPPATARLRRNVSDPSNTRAGASKSNSMPRTLSRDEGPNIATAKPGFVKRNSGTSSTSHVTSESSAGSERMRSSARPPRQLPPLSASDHKLTTKGQERAVRSKSLDAGQGNDPDTLFAVGPKRGSLNSRPSTGVPPRKPDGSQSTNNKSPTRTTTDKKVLRKQSSSRRIRVRAKFIIPQIVITTCPDMEFPDPPFMPLAPTPSSNTWQPSHSASERQRTTVEKKKETNTVMGSFSVS